MIENINKKIIQIQLNENNEIVNDQLKFWKRLWNWFLSPFTKVWNYGIIFSHITIYTWNQVYEKHQLSFSGWIDFQCKVNLTELLQVIIFSKLLGQFYVKLTNSFSDKLFLSPIWRIFRIFSLMAWMTINVYKSIWRNFLLFLRKIW